MTTPFWTPKHPCAAMVAVTVAIGVISPILTWFGSPGLPGFGPLFTIPCGIALIALQLWHSYAVCRGERPRGGWLTMPAMLALCYVPMIWYTWDWLAYQNFVTASLAMVLPKSRFKAAVVAMPTVVLVIVLTVRYVVTERPWGLSGGIFELVWWGVILPVGAAVVYGAARMVRMTTELRDARTELAELAIAQERLRVSRDLHDLVGQSLSAVSLRGDLALRLLDANPEAAHAEIATLTATARNALHDVLTVTRDGTSVDLRTELDGARALLNAAGIGCSLSLDCLERDELGPGARTVFAWALREGITNVLRHSDATTCSITGSAGDSGLVRLEIVNDGVRRANGTGSGLAGLTERARAFGGEVTAGREGGRFRLLVELRGEDS